MKKYFLLDFNINYLLRNITYPTGGASVQSLNWIYGLSKCGYKAIIISSFQFKSDEVIVERININSTRSFKYLRIFVLYFILLKKHSPEFIYISTPDWSHLFVNIIAKCLKIKVIQRISNDYLVDSRAKKRFGYFKYMLFDFHLRLSNLILCQNIYQFENIKRSYRKVNVEIIYNPYRYSRINSFQQHRSYIAWVGIFQYQKNLPELVRVAKDLPHLSFRVAGACSSSIDEETRCAFYELKKLKNVKLVGLIARDEVNQFLSNAICLLNTSRYEGFSNTFLESFSAHTPVVTRKVIDPDGIIQRYSLGLVVNEYSELSNAITELTSNKIYQSDNYEKYLLLHHNPEMLAHRLLKILI